MHTLGLILCLFVWYCVNRRVTLVLLLYGTIGKPLQGFPSPPPFLIFLSKSLYTVELVGYQSILQNH